MAAHADILDRPDSLAAPFWTSFIMHLLVIGGLLGATLIQNQFRIKLGSPNGGGIGVLVTPVSSIPLPNQGGAQNPVANDTKSEVPAPPPKKEKAPPAPKPKPLTESEKLLLAMEKAPNRKQPEPQPNKFREKQQDAVNQLYSQSGQRLSSNEYNMQGGGGFRIGTVDPFGEQFGAYANIVRQNIAQNWRPTNQSARGAGVVLTFTIHKDGSVTDVKIAKSSGNQLMDNSALRAVQDVHLPPLPLNFPRSQADVQLAFELGN